MCTILYYVMFICIICHCSNKLFTIKKNIYLLSEHFWDTELKKKYGTKIIWS